MEQILPLKKSKLSTTEAENWLPNGQKIGHQMGKNWPPNGQKIGRQRGQKLVAKWAKNRPPHTVSSIL